MDMFEQGVPLGLDPERVPALYLKRRDGEGLERWNYKNRQATQRLMTLFVNRATGDSLGLPDYAWVSEERKEKIRDLRKTHGPVAR